MGTQVPAPAHGEDELAASPVQAGRLDAPVMVDRSPVMHAVKDVPSTRASRAWTKVLPAVILLAVILVFVFQNLHRAKVHFLGMSGTFPLAVSLLAATALGGLFVLALGSVRILQLRKVIRRGGKTAPAVRQGQRQ